MTKERRGSHDSVALVYGIARAAYRDQFSQRDQQRTRCGALLAVAGILATLSITAAGDAHGSLLIFCGIVALICAAGLFFAGIVWFNLETTPRGQILGNTVSGYTTHRSTSRVPATSGDVMGKLATTKPSDTGTGDDSDKTPQRDKAEPPPKSPLPPPDPRLDGIQKRGFGVFKRGPSAQ